MPGQNALRTSHAASYSVLLMHCQPGTKINTHPSAGKMDPSPATLSSPVTPAISFAWQPCYDASLTRTRILIR